MQSGVNAFLPCAALAVLMVALPARAENESGGSVQQGEGRWVPSLAILSGAIFQDQDATILTELFEGTDPDPVAFQPPCNTRDNPTCSPVPVVGDDLLVAPFVGGSLELMSPAFPIPTRPRFFASGEILPTFSSERDIAVSGSPDCIRGPLVEDVTCAVDQVGSRNQGFGESEANGQGVVLSTQYGTLVYGANLGLSFPLRFGERQLRIKPSVGWLNYEVEVAGLVSNAACDPEDNCTNSDDIGSGFLRTPTALSASDAQRFNGIGPGIDIEVDTGRFGPIGSALFLGGRAYHVLGDRTISFGTSQTYDDLVNQNAIPPRASDRAVAAFAVEVDPWIFRAHVGIRFQWLGRPN